MKKIAFLIYAGLSACQVNAECVGTDTYYTCNDDSGNSYQVSKFGNSTITNGYNYNTGSTWNSTSTTLGDSTYQYGSDSEGRLWNQQIQKLGESTIRSGVNSEGESFYKVCNQYGCY